MNKGDLGNRDKVLIELCKKLTIMGNSTKKWYALYTKPGCEKRVSNLLSRKNIENFCPVKRQWNGRKKVVLEPLFNSYVFIQITEAEMPIVRSTDTVVNFVYWLGKPAVINHEEIEIMKRFMNEYANVKLEKIPLDVNGRVRIIGANPADSKANIASVKNNTVKIILPSLGYMMIAEIEKSNVEVITSTKQFFASQGKYQYAI